MLNRIRTEPALVTGLIRAVLLCLVAFGFKLEPGQIAAVMLVAEAGLSLFVRAKVVPLTYPDNEAGAVEPGSLALGVVISLIVAALAPSLFR